MKDLWFFIYHDPNFKFLISIAIAFLLFLLGKRPIKVIYHRHIKPIRKESIYKKLELPNNHFKSEIKTISAHPWIDNGMGGWNTSCYIVIEVTNPSDENEITAEISDPLSSNLLASMKQKKLPALKTTPFKIEFSHEIFNSEEAVDKIRGHELLLTIKDIHGKEIKKSFLFEDMP